MNETFDFTEWSLYHLEERASDLIDTQMIPHTEKRKEAIAREISHIFFELDHRYEEGETK
jgi:hypothetical protein